MPLINGLSPDLKLHFNIIEKFMRDLELPQDMSATNAPPSGHDRIREPEIPSSGPVTSFGGRIPKVQGHNFYTIYPLVFILTLFKVATESVGTSDKILLR